MGLRKPLGAFSAIIIVVVFGAAVFAGWPPLVDMNDAQPFLSRYEAEESFFDYDEAKFMEIGLQKEAPSASHWLGTDDQARDTWSRIIWGSRRSLRVGLGALAIGTSRRCIHRLHFRLLSRPHSISSSSAFMDAFQAFPPILFLILMVTDYCPHRELAHHSLSSDLRAQRVAHCAQRYHHDARNALHRGGPCHRRLGRRGS